MSPLVLHAPGVLVVWPALALAVAALGHVLALRTRRRRRSRAAGLRS